MGGHDPGRPGSPGVPAGAVLLAAYGIGAIPFSNIAARLTAGVDLRRVGTGTVSGTSLYRVGGFAPLAAAGVLDVLKGAAGPLLAGRHRPRLAALAGGAAVAGHNWSPFLRGAGGRGLSPALGALGAQHWPAAAVIAGGMAGGRLARQTALGSFVSFVALVPLSAHTGGRRAARAGAAVLAPLVAKRLTGNEPPPPGAPWRQALRSRLLFDRDPGPPG